MDTRVYEGDQLKKHSILDVRTHFKPTKISQYMDFNSCHHPGTRKGFINGKALRLLRTISLKVKFDKHTALFKQ